MKYIGLVSGTRDTDGLIIITDMPKGVKSIDSAKVSIGFSQNFAKEYVVEKFDITKVRGYLKLVGINSREEAREFKDMGVFADDEAIVFHKKNQYLVNDLIGCKVFDVDSGDLLGEIIDVWYLPANDVWVLDHEQGEVPIPVIEDVVKSVNVGKKEIKIKMLDGLLDLTNDDGKDDEMDDGGEASE
jgi:16S rRNA processing protein RimM